MITKRDGISVSEFVKKLKDVVDHHPSFNNVTLIGELSNFKAHQSGHFYFTLKDEGSRIQCVMFRSKASSVLFNPKDGDKVIVTGSAEVYEAQGSIQLYATRMEQDGLGALYIQFEALKRQFINEGLFDASHKRPLPKYPTNISVIVGKDSAAYHDIRRTLAQRWPLAQVTYLFAAVQGLEAKDSLLKQLATANSMDALDVIIMARGGGSIEDLQAFNHPDVVRAVYNSTIPVICGVGHESDVTLVDYVCDYRAATPTAAAVAATPNANDILTTIRNYKNTYYIRVKNMYQRDIRRYQTLMTTSKLSDPINLIEKKQMQLDFIQGTIFRHTRHFDAASKTISNLSVTIQQSINRRIQESRFIISYNTKDMTNKIDTYLLRKATRNDKLQASILEKVTLSESKYNRYRYEINTLDNTIEKALNRSVALKKRSLVDIIRHISGQNPMAKLASIYERGFALISDDKGEIIQSIDKIDNDKTIRLSFKDGLAHAKVTRKEYYDDKD